MKYRNTVALIGHYGSDLTHAGSAWTSTTRELTEDRLARVPDFLKRLAQDGHHTVFEKSSLHFLVTSDIASHIHLIKHRVGVSVNTESARYKELKEDKFYLPDDWSDELQAELVAHTEVSFYRYHQTLERLERAGVPRKRAKESARYFLPYNTQLVQDVMFNWRSFHHFLGLRLTEHAQVEIRDIAREMLQQVAATNEFNHTIAAFGWDKHLEG